MGLKKPTDVPPGPAQLFTEVDVNLEWVVKEKAYLHCLYPSDWRQQQGLSFTPLSDALQVSYSESD